MKNFITTILASIIMTLSFSSFAKSVINPLKDMEVGSIVNSYLKATVIGKIELNKFLYSNDFVYENTASNQKIGKGEYLNFLKKNKGLTYNCTTSYEILDSNRTSTVAKASYKFENFTRVDHITLVKSSDGWKINKIITSYI